MVEFIVLLGMIIGLVEFYMIVAWWGNGCLKGIEAWILFGLDGLLLTVLIGNPSIPVKLLVMLLLFAPYIWIYQMFNAGKVKDFYEQEARKYRATIDLNPNNWPAREFLAHTLYKLKDLDGAIAEMQLAVDMNPDPEKGKYCLREWGREQRERQTSTTICSHCGEENALDRNWCRKCEKKLYRFQDKAIYQRLGLRGIIAISGALTVLVVSFSFLPVMWAIIPIGCMLLAIAGWKLASDRR